MSNFFTFRAATVAANVKLEKPFSLLLFRVFKICIFFRKLKVEILQSSSNPPHSSTYYFYYDYMRVIQQCSAMRYLLKMHSASHLRQTTYLSACHYTYKMPAANLF